ncbi:MAG: hypothetical protein KAS95_04305 [Candidatus Heimdallarchaeota archaeon]|nr:hypothetical protein [Candidatus Heimdallarchaeota archaeon]
MSNGFSSLYYGILIKLKTLWYMKRKRKMQKSTKNFLKGKLQDAEIKFFDDKIIENYLNIFNLLLDKNIYEKILTIKQKKG